MKKVFLFCAAVAALVLSASCNKDGGNTGGKVVIPAAEYAAEAKKLELANSDSSNPGIKSIEFTESGRYIICKQVVDGQTGPLSVKAETSLEYIHGTYTVNNNVYTLNGYGTVTVSGNQITINTSGGDNIVVNYTEAAKYPANDFYTTIARAWTVEKTDISVVIEAGKPAVGVVKDGCNIPAILKELEEKANVDLKDEEFAGYVVKEINFTMSKTIEIAFTGKSPVAGPISISENGAVSYELNGSAGVEVLSGKASGTFDLNPGLGANKIILSLNTELTTKSGKTYNGTVRFILSPAA